MARAAIEATADPEATRPLGAVGAARAALLVAALGLPAWALMGCGGDQGDSAARAPSVQESAGSPHAPLLSGLPCRRCEIELEFVAEVTDAGSDEVHFTDQEWPRRDRRGRIYMTTVPWDRFAVFDSAGALIKTLGQRGQGPGEFSRAGPLLLDPSDSIWVWDHPMARATIYSPELEFVRTFRSPAPPTHFLPDGTLLSLEEVRDAGLIGLPAHRLSRTGEVLGSFGRDSPRYRPDQRLLYMNAGGLSPSGLLWMSPKGRYELQLWDPLEERHLETLHPEAPWFEGILPGSSYRADRPSSIVSRIWTDDIGVVWVLVQLAALDWAPCCDGEPPPHEAVPIEEKATYLDWILQAVDPETGAVLAERRFEYPLMSALGEGRDVFTIHPDERTGSVEYRLWRPRLIPNPGR